MFATASASSAYAGDRRTGRRPRQITAPPARQFRRASHPTHKASTAGPAVDRMLCSGVRPLDRVLPWPRSTMSVTDDDDEPRPAGTEQGPPSIARRAVLEAIAGGIAGLMLPKTANAKAATTGMPFDQWIATFRTKAEARGITAETYTRVMRTVRPDMGVLEAIRNQPEFNEQLWQYLNRVTSDWKIAAGKEKAKQYAALFERIEKDFGVEPSIMLGVWGIESGVRRSDRGQEPHAAGLLVARHAGLGRAAPARLLGKRTDQCAHHRAARLEHAGRNGRLLGRRHGPHPMDAGGVAARRHGLQQRRQDFAVRPARRRARIDRALFRRARQISPRRALGL